MSEGILVDVESPAAQRIWSAIAADARRRRLGIEIRDGTPEKPYAVRGKERSELEVEVGSYERLDQAFAAAERWVVEHPLPGPVALRDELREHGRKLAILTPRQLNRKGGDFELYRRFRDRILPLAYDNLVDSVRLEALEDFIRRVGGSMEAIDSVSKANRAKALEDALTTLAAEARGLVAPKED